jgi:hypothetical protein
LLQRPAVARFWSHPGSWDWIWRRKAALAVRVLAARGGHMRHPLYVRLFIMQSKCLFFDVSSSMQGFEGINRPCKDADPPAVKTTRNVRTSSHKVPRMRASAYLTLVDRQIILSFFSGFCQLPRTNRS